MATRTKLDITAQLREVVKGQHVEIVPGDNAGQTVLRDSVSLTIIFITLLLVAIEVLLNIRNGETA